jgi:hypothetical protein
MNLTDKTRDALQSWPRFSQGSNLLVVAEGGHALECELTALDTLACEFASLIVRHARLAKADMPALVRASEALALRLNYLLEPIRPIEIDRDQCVVQMRSQPPQKTDDASSYYELLVRQGGVLSLRRYTKEADQPRRIAPALVTIEVFLRLAADFEAAA